MKQIAELVKHLQQLIVTMQENPIGAFFAAILVFFICQHGKIWM